MAVLPITIDQLLRLKKKTSDDPELYDFAKQLEGLTYRGGKNYQILLVDEDGLPVDDETLQILQLLWAATHYKQLH
jgi:hypothetical protein